MGVASASDTMEGVSTTGASVLIFSVDFSSGETRAFLSYKGGVGVGVGGAEAELGRFVKILFHSSFALLNLDILTQHNSPSLRRHGVTWFPNKL